MASLQAVSKRAHFQNYGKSIAIKSFFLTQKEMNRYGKLITDGTSYKSHSVGINKSQAKVLNLGSKILQNQRVAM